MKKLGLVLAATATVAVAGEAFARDEISIVGSSTVFPFATAVAEQYAKNSGAPTPVIKSTGSGGGMKLFCAGVGTEHPDITNASRRMKSSEFELCNENGVTSVVEAVVGYDGIVVANSNAAPTYELTRGQLCQALVVGAMDPAPMTWDQIDPALPAVKIEVLGPPPSSGTRDAFEELALEEGCEEIGFEGDIEVRDDGVYVDAGENDNLIVSKLEANPTALGVFGFSFLDQNKDKIHGSLIEGVEPTFDAIASGDYPLSRSLYFYVKTAHVGVVPGVMEYVNEFTSTAASGNGGYLADKGLIPLPAADHESNRNSVLSLTPLTADAWN